MSDDPAFLAAIASDPDADAPRLAHAGWLDGRDPPRAEFIRLQVRQARAGGYAPLPPDTSGRISILQREHGKRWNAGRPDVGGMSWRFVRGYPEEVTYSSFTAFATTWKRALVPPLRWVAFHDLRDLSRLAESPGLARVRWLRLHQHGFDDEDLRLILESPHLERLAGLSVNRGILSGASLALVASSPKLAGLRELDLAGSCRVAPTAEDVAALAASPNLAGLRSLALNGWGIKGEVARALWAGRWPDLGTLLLRNNELDAQGLIGLGDGAAMPALAELDLFRNRLADDGAEALARATRWTSLRRLELEANGIGERGAAALGGAAHLAGLERLGLRSNSVTDAGAAALARLGGLVSLTLSSNVIGDAGMMALGRSAELSRLVNFDGASNPARPEVIAAATERFRDRRPPLAEAPPLPVVAALPMEAPGEAIGQADEDGLVREMLADPHDDLARNVYADWLEENGSPLHARLLRMPLGDPGRRALVANIAKPIIEAFPDFNVSVSEDEGLIVVHMQLRGYLTKAFERDGPAWLRRNRIARLSLIGESKDWAKTGNLPVAAHLRGLGMRGCNLRDKGVEQLAAATGLGGLCSLDLRGTRVGTAGAMALGRSPHFPRLAHLHLGSTRPGPEGLRALVSGPLAASLRRLDLDGTRVSDLGVAVLAQSPGLANLVTLGLGSNWLSDQSSQSLAASPHLARLRSLDLGRNRLGDAGLHALARSSFAGRLRWLGLVGLGQGTLEGWRALAGTLHPACRVCLYNRSAESFLAPLREILGNRIVLEGQ